MVYLVSAACLLGSAAAILVPAMRDDGGLPERVAAVGAVVGYLGCLLGVVVVVLGWMRAHPDAVGPVLLSAALIAGAGVAAGTIALQAPLAAFSLGLLGCLVIGGLAPLALRRLAVPICAAWVWPAGLMIAWLLIWPAVTGWVASAGAPEREAATAAVIRWGWCLPGLAAILAVGIGRDRPIPAVGGPLLAWPGLAWAWLVLLVAGGCSQAVILPMLFLVEWKWGEVLVLALPASLLVATVIAGRRHQRWLDQLAWLLVFVLALAVINGNGGNPVALTLGSVAWGLAWWRWSPGSPGPAIQASGLAVAALVYALADTGRAWQPIASWALLAGVMTSGALWLALAWRRGSPACAAVGAMHLGLVAGRVAVQLFGLDRGMLVPVTIIGAIQGVIVVLLLRPRDLPRDLALITAATLAILGFFLRPATAPGWTFAWGLAFGVELAFLAWRCRDPRICLAAGAVVAPDFFNLVRRHLAWVGIGSAFALLALGLLVSRRHVLAGDGGGSGAGPVAPPRTGKPADQSE